MKNKSKKQVKNINNDDEKLLLSDVIVAKRKICPICNNELTYYAGLNAYSCNKKECSWVGQI